MLALLLLEVNWICVLLRLVSTQLDSIIEERVRPEGYERSPSHCPTKKPPLRLTQGRSLAHLSLTGILARFN